MQLVAYGAQDIYLTGNPQITFFKVVYRRHTNFSMEAIEQVWDGPSTSAGRCTSTIARNGDLITRMYLELTGTIKSNQDNPTACSITDVELEIGGQKIDKQTGLFMEVWSELTEPNPSARVGALTAADTVNGTLFQNMSGMGGVGNDPSDVWQAKFFVPLYFWFCRNPGLALPLIALQYHEVKLVMNHTLGTEITSPTNKLWCDYIYLDTDERRRFAQVSHEYLIEQIQEQELNTGAAASTTSTSLKFNHPVKELIWTTDTTFNSSSSGGSLDSVASALPVDYLLKLNGQDRFAKRDSRYFTRTQIWQHHSGSGGLNSGKSAASDGALNDSIAVYSFSLKPEEHQPSGTCNFSRIDEAEFSASGSGTNVANKMFAINYNVLRIMSGMGGLAYSN